MVNVVCMKWGTAYGPEYVNKLYRGIARNMTIPHRFVCFTDDTAGVDDAVECRPLPPIILPDSQPLSAFRKIALFAEKLDDLTGKTLFLDLDVIIVDNIDCFFTLETDFCIIHNWVELRKQIFRPRPQIGNSSVFRYNIGEHVYILETYLSDIDRAFTGFPTEQAFLSATVRSLVFWPETWCRSFKRHCIPLPPLNWLKTPRIPKGAKIVVFHGRPNPDEAGTGYHVNWRKYARPVPWVSEYWV